MGKGRLGFLLVLMLSAWFLNGCTAGHPEPSPSPAEGPGPMESMVRTIDHFMADGVVSVVVQVRWPGGEWTNAYGGRSLDNDDPARTQDRFSAGSVTKSMVAAEVLKLVDEGRLSLDDPVEGTLRELAPMLHPPGHVSVRQLLNHTSGMPDFVAPLYTGRSLLSVEGTRLSMLEGLKLAATQAWESRNVGYFNYSNANYLALGLLIENLRHKPLAQALGADIFRPLSLDRTSLGEPDRTAGDNLHGYIADDAVEVDVTQAEGLVGSPASGIVSTTEDINDFYRALLGGRLVSAKSLSDMKMTGLGNYGLGLIRSGDGCSAGYRYGHSGDVFGYLTASITSDDGGSQVTMAVALPPLPAEGNTAVERRVKLYAAQMQSAAQETLDRLCQ
ncbi:serine hydrolase domain-containing protein [Paenarthrobacter nitroguajacolicus]|uniref:serine hydrolase domain-containing protein n=1 Tax=Paenarthrobacter nitroguajacolicus TaxID=211146 RepID=UPI00248D169D|nr:serine hydrolase domain-containing protein [Paenarthrobacter nitroguajacolicus]MDI2035680.1 hypothetical protein [Paenarthrobacter nitroguajacolicus]